MFLTSPLLKKESKGGEWEGGREGGRQEEGGGGT